MTAVELATKVEATERAERIRKCMKAYALGVDEVARAWEQQDWRTLDYASWDAYVLAEFGPERVKLPTDQREHWAVQLRLSGMSNRAIASATGVSEATVRRSLAGASYDAPERITGKDGKKHPATKSVPHDVNPLTAELDELTNSAPNPERERDPEAERYRAEQRREEAAERREQRDRQRQIDKLIRLAQDAAEVVRGDTELLRFFFGKLGAQLDEVGFRVAYDAMSRVAESANLADT